MPFRTRAAAMGTVLAAAAMLLCPATATAVAGPAAAPKAASAPGWSLAPAPGDGARPSPQDRPYFYLEGGPGTVLKDRLSVSNPGERPVTVRLRGTGAGSWIALAAQRVRIPPRTRASVPFTVTVPPDAVPGDHPGAIVATGDGERNERTKRSRVAVHLRVTGPTLSALTVEHVSVSGRGSAAVIRYALVNRGNTVLRPRLAVRADGLFGPLLRRAARTLPVELRPGQRVDRTENWPDPPALDAVHVRLTAAAEDGAHGSATAAYTPAPWGAVAGAALLLAAGAGGWTVVRRRRRRVDGDGADADGADPGAGGDGGDDGPAAHPQMADEARELAGTRTGSGVRS
ncbi:hypothetical protein FCH28_34320 [Streptomyces piniterrae]|uniref:DUF916 domain-containing protein n=1 Tax=Streptomyces piniterrae TaxID=2571125 RepID=A0A4U0MZ30_9ACTN|nr:hypothetical protein [Streptomyces piniterrae]TJZ42484.1 hypothetical protein FCH28_34320 [Streptomyces piniterrae]